MGYLKNHENYEKINIKYLKKHKLIILRALTMSMSKDEIGPFSSEVFLRFLKSSPANFFHNSS